MNQLRITKPIGWRGAALMPVAALLVHQLRYLLAFGPDSGHALAAQGHGYLSSLAPWIALVAAVGVGGLFARFVSAWRGKVPEHARSTSTLMIWVAASLALVALYTGQELLEGFFATGHPGGIGGVLGGGGWWAIPAAHTVALALVLLLRGADVLTELIAGRRLRSVRRAPRISAPAIPRVLGRRLAPLARAAAGRAPPLFAAS
jgi:hypothetical protein